MLRLFLRKALNRKTGRTYLSIVESYRVPGVKNSRSRTIKSLGYLDELKKQYEDPIAFFEAEIARMNAEQEKKDALLTLTIDRNETIKKDAINRKNFGYVALSQIYHELEVDKFIRNRQRHAKHEYDANAIIRMLVFSRLLDPNSKKHDWENRHPTFPSRIPTSLFLF